MPVSAGGPWLRSVGVPHATPPPTAPRAPRAQGRDIVDPEARSKKHGIKGRDGRSTDKPDAGGLAGSHNVSVKRTSGALSPATSRAADYGIFTRPGVPEGGGFIPADRPQPPDYQGHVAPRHSKEAQEGDGKLGLLIMPGGAIDSNSPRNHMHLEPVRSARNTVGVVGASAEQRTLSSGEPARSADGGIENLHVPTTACLCLSRSGGGVAGLRE